MTQRRSAAKFSGANRIDEAGRKPDEGKKEEREEGGRFEGEREWGRERWAESSKGT
jgi:hypothetical protein